MSFQVTDAFVLQFTGNVRLLAQQVDSRLRGTILEQEIPAEGGYFEQIGQAPARKRQSRHADSPLMNTPHARRRIAPYDYEWGELVDQLDKVKMLIDPVSGYAQAAAAAMNRAVDDEIIAGFFGTAYTGHTGSTAVTWPNGNSEVTPTLPAGLQIAVNDTSYGNVSGNTGLTVGKLIKAKMTLLAAEGDTTEEHYIAVNGAQLGNLLATTEATNADYNTVKALVRGEIDTFLGFKFIHSERLLLNGSGYTRVPAWRKSGMGLGIAKDMEARVAERADKGFAWYVYAMESIGASRLEENKIVEIICA